MQDFWGEERRSCSPLKVRSRFRLRVGLDEQPWWFKILRSEADPWIMNAAETCFTSCSAVKAGGDWEESGVGRPTVRFGAAFPDGSAFTVVSLGGGHCFKLTRPLERLTLEATLSRLVLQCRLCEAILALAPYVCKRLYPPGNGVGNFPSDFIFVAVSSIPEDRTLWYEGRGGREFSICLTCLFRNNSITAVLVEEWNGRGVPVLLIRVVR